jgi:hypothetical protein
VEGNLLPKSRIYFTFAVLFLVVGISATLLAKDEKSPNEEQRAKAVNVVRLINTAELSYSNGTKKDGSDAHGHYASWDELYKSGILKTVQDQWPMVKDLKVSASPELMPGYQLDLLVSANGKSYSIALHDKRDGDGLFSVFSDQNGIIFLGSPLQ